MLRLLLGAILALPLGLDLYLPVPDSNPLRRDRVELGRRLFFDTALSRDRTISCASCHDPARGFADGRRLAAGVFNRSGRRNAPTLVNLAYAQTFFWDGRATSLEAQVLEPIQDPNEMQMTLDEASARVGLPVHIIAEALASYLRSILSGDSRFDRFAAGDTRAMTDEERAGWRVFESKAGCRQCHIGPTFSDELFHNTGVAWREGGADRPGQLLDAGANGPGELADAGRFAVSGRERDRGAFKTPTLREIDRTAPYMHDGSLASLEEVVEYYDRGGNPNPWLDPALRPLRLTPDEKRALVAFLVTLSGTVTEGLLSLREDNADKGDGTLK